MQFGEFGDEFRDLCRWAESRSVGRHGTGLVVSCRRLNHVDPVYLIDLAFSRHERAFFWSSPDRRRSLIGIGSSAEFQAHGANRFQQVRYAWRAARDHSVVAVQPGCDEVRGPIAVGGFAFADSMSPMPDRLPDALMWVPEVVVATDEGGRCTLVLTAAVAGAAIDCDQTLAKAADLLGSRSGQPVGSGSAREVRSLSLPPPQEWLRLVAETVDHVERGDFRKVVLARKLEVLADSDFDVPGALRVLLADQNSTTVFGVRMQTDTFLGATPERLVRLRDSRAETVSLAGSA